MSLLDTEDGPYSTNLIRDVVETNGMPPPQLRQLHVLVVVREGAVDLKSKTFRIDFLVDKVGNPDVHSVLSKPKRYVHSQMRSTKEIKLVRELKFHAMPVDAVPFTGGRPTPIEKFEWIKGRIEEEQSGRHRDYVEGNIGDVLRSN